MPSVGRVVAIRCIRCMSKNMWVKKIDLHGILIDMLICNGCGHIDLYQTQENSSV